MKVLAEKIKVKNNKGLNLSTVLERPNKNGKFPTVILLHGFTGYKEEKHIVLLAKNLSLLVLWR